MTVIAYRSGILAADSRETWGDGDTHGICEKLYRKKVGRREHILATAGDTYSGMVYHDWYGTGKDVPEALSKLDGSEDFQVLVWDGKQLFHVNHMCRMVPVIESYFAIGCGRKAALGAMAMGASAKRAVQIACQIDPFCGLPVVTMRLK